jgi:hypothetical protein
MPLSGSSRRRKICQQGRRSTMWTRGAALVLLAAFSLSAHASEATHLATPLQTAARTEPPDTGPAHKEPELTGAAQTEPAAPEAAPTDTLIFGLTGPQLAVGVAIGAGLGAVAVAASGNTLAGAGLGTLAAIYVAHLAVEAVVVGGMFYLWPSEDEGSGAPSRKMPIRGPAGSSSPILPQQTLGETARCRVC